MLEIHLELGHELLLLNWLHVVGLGVGGGVSSSCRCTPVVGVVLLHLLVRLHEVNLVMVDSLLVGGREGPRFVFELLMIVWVGLKGLLMLLGLLWCQVMLFTII